MNFWEALILGIIQGLTEFLPVSSSGHIELGKALLDVEPKDPLLFSVMVHAATALSTLVVFRKTILDLFKDLFKFKWNEGTRYIFLIVVSMIPVGIVGVFFEQEIEVLFEGNILLVGCMLMVTAFLLFATTKISDKKQDVTIKRSVLVGIAQAIAVLPGISRSGATISTALLSGMGRQEAARFSFLMVLPPILGATLLKLKDYLEAGASVEVETQSLVVGFLGAFLTGWAACTWMIAIVKRAKLQYFAYYCGVVGIIAIISHWF